MTPTRPIPSVAAGADAEFFEDVEVQGESRPFARLRSSRVAVERRLSGDGELFVARVAFLTSPGPFFVVNPDVRLVLDPLNNWSVERRSWKPGGKKVGWVRFDWKPYKTLRGIAGGVLNSFAGHRAPDRR